jgi:hypothetical protein
MEQDHTWDAVLLRRLEKSIQLGQGVEDGRGGVDYGTGQFVVGIWSRGGWQWQGMIWAHEGGDR